MTKEKALIREEFRRGRWQDGGWTGGTGRQMKKWFGPGEKHPAVRRYLRPVDVCGPRPGNGNVGMKFWNERTMKKRGWVGTERSRQR